MRNYPFFILLVLILAFSCQNPFAPPLIGPGSFRPIARQTDPDSVLFNFKYAYENRDSVVYANCLDKDFVFIYYDQDEFDKIVRVDIERDGPGNDLDITGRMFRYFDEIQLNTWIIQAQPDSVGTLKIRDVSFDLYLEDIDGDYGYQRLYASGSRAHFVFKINPEDSLWRILMWDDRLN